MATDYAVAMRLAAAMEHITQEMGRLGVLVSVPVPELTGHKDKGLATAIRLETVAGFLERVNVELGTPKADAVEPAPKKAGKGKK